MKNNKLKILLVEDDENLGFILKDYLELVGYTVDLQRNGNSGMTSFLTKKFDLCLLDIMLPFKDGFTLAEEIRKKDINIPIIFLTAKNMKEDKIRGFKIGADDYITKPFSTEELSLRIDAIFKRIKSGNITTENEIFDIGIYKFDYLNQVLLYNSQEKRLTKRESDVLRMLCINKNQLLKREIALKNIWGSDDYFMGRSMDVYIAKLRKYFNDDPSINIINIHGSGFKLEVK